MEETKPAVEESAPDYFESVFPAPPVVCGKQLLPLSLGLYQLMAHFKVAFVAESEREATPGDLLVAVLICSMGPADFGRFAAQPDFGKKIRKWGSKIGFFEPRCYRWPMIGKKLREWLEPAFADTDFKYLTEQMDAFQRYVVEGSRTPEFWDESPDSKISAAHWSQSVEVVLRGQLGWEKEEIESAPLGKALWDYFKHFENLGMVRLIGKEEAAQLSHKLTEQESKEAEEQAAKALAYLQGLREKEANG